MKSLFNQILSHLAASLIHLSPKNRNLTISAVNGDCYKKNLQTAFNFDIDASKESDFMAILSLKNVSLTFGGPALLDSISIQIESGERVGLLGQNGTGKTTLLRLIQGDLLPDDGEVSYQQTLRTAYLPQGVLETVVGTTREIAAAGLEGCQFTDEGNEEEWQRQIQVDQVLSKLELDPDLRFELLSAGLKRRVLLAKGLVRNPELLLLDEPTNHLDIEAIDWLESFIKRWGGTLVFVTHDRMFLEHMSTRIVELDRGGLFDWHCDYATFRTRKENLLEAQGAHNDEFDKLLAKEEQWIRRGIEARRTRNMGRVRSLQQLRKIRQERREQPGKVQLQIQEARRSGDLVIETENLTFQYDGVDILKNFSTTIMRGDKVGIIGPNGSGKTTLLRLLLGELEAQTGSIRLGTNLKVAYFDQLRAQLDESKSIMENVGQGRDFVIINGRPRNLIGYLGDFLFSKDLINAPIISLSGGERNRLLLARLFTQPCNLLILDEPTNDLDIETLEILENMLLEYEGTLLLVSHDRAFLNNLVTSTIVLDGAGNAKEYVGGYDDFQEEQQAEVAQNAPKKVPAAPKKDKVTAESKAKLTFKEKKELEDLPAKIEALDAEHTALTNAMANSQFYQRRPEEIQADTDRYYELEKLLEITYLRWEELEKKH